VDHIAVRERLGAPDLAPIDTPEHGPLKAEWLGRIGYRDAWALQKEAAAARADDRIPDQLFLLEHEPVLTLGRQADEAHVRASGDELRRRGIEVIRVERGGEVTYHGPGQLVAYPIIALSRRGLMLRPLVRALEGAMLDTCGAFGVAAIRRDGHPGCWVDGSEADVTGESAAWPPASGPRKIGALGLRVERGVSYHGIALNIDPDLADFELIDACGMPGVVSTSIAVEAGRPGEPPSTAAVEHAGRVFAAAFARRIGVELDLP
jgi:lipoate-protein ligase B